MKAFETDQAELLLEAMTAAGNLGGDMRIKGLSGFEIRQKSNGEVLVINSVSKTIPERYGDMNEFAVAYGIL